jgi:hypothetical protein
MLTVNVSAPSVVESAVVLMLKLPVPVVMVKLPDVAVKSAVVVLTSVMVQYKVVPEATLTVFTVTVKLEPSSTELVNTIL